MLCPECNHQLQGATVKTNTGDVVLDYCGACGGIWSDHGEINFVTQRQLGILEDIVPKKPLHTAGLPPICPRDRTVLSLFTAESIPRDMTVYRCSKCQGMWFPKESLFKLKAAQEVKLAYFKQWRIPLHSIYAILLPLLVIVILGGSLFATLVGVQKDTDLRSRASDILSQPLVIAPVGGEVIISFSTLEPTRTKIKYWIQPDEIMEIWISATPQKVHTVKLKNLDPAKSYSYQIKLLDPTEVESEIYFFVPQPGQN